MSAPLFSISVACWSIGTPATIQGAIAGTVAILEHLKQAALPLYVIRNWPEEAWGQAESRFDFLGWFDGLVISGFEGVAKPKKAIFDLALTRFDLSPPRTLFIDDSAANVEAARRFGYEAVQFTGPQALRVTLVENGLLPRQSWL